MLGQGTPTCFHTPHIGHACVRLDAFVLQRQEGLKVTFQLAPRERRPVFEQDDMCYRLCHGVVLCA